MDTLDKKIIIQDVLAHMESKCESITGRLFELIGYDGAKAYVGLLSRKGFQNYYIISASNSIGNCRLQVSS